MESQVKDTVFSKQRSLRLGEKLIMLDHPLIMGIINLSSDSFYTPLGLSREEDPEWFLEAAEKMIPWCDIIDLGGISTRPGSMPVSEEEELRRISVALPKLKKAYPDIAFSVDTYRGKVAEAAAGLGACLINDISGGSMDPGLLPAVARTRLPYVYSHILGTPATMQDKPEYTDVVADVFRYFSEGLQKLYDMGIFEVILDPGFGFGKTVDHNFQLLKGMEEFKTFQRPLLAGFSRKSMIQKALHTDALGSLNGTTVLNTVALLKGVDILRVHDPREAKEAIILTEKMKNA